WRRVDFRCRSSRKEGLSLVSACGRRAPGGGCVGRDAGELLQDFRGQKGFTMAPLFQRLFVGDEEEERPKAAKGAPPEGAPERTESQKSSGETAQDTTILTQNTLRESQEGLIPASKLPPAADALAELFAETPATGKTAVAEAAQPAKISEMKADESATSA